MQNLKKDLTWDYVANPSGGFLGAWWYFQEWNNADVYLQIEQGRLCFKIAVDDSEHQSELRQLWHEKIIESARKHGISTICRPPRFGKGVWMTVAIINLADWLCIKEGRIDLDATQKQLSNAEIVLSSAIRDSFA